MAEVRSDLVTMQYSTDLTFPISAPSLKTIQCETDSEAGGESSPTETKTKACGTLVSPGTAAFTASGNGVVRANPASDEASFQEILNLINLKRRVYAVYKNEADTEAGVAVGDGVHIEGEGYFTSARATSETDDVVKFSWSFSWSGTVNTIPGS